MPPELGGGTGAGGAASDAPKSGRDYDPFRRVARAYTRAHGAARN